MRIISSSVQQTYKVAGSLLKNVYNKMTPGTGQAVVIGLYGDLGSGKTTFIQGFGKALGIREKITSPTFVILKRFRIKKNPRFKNLIHIDAYRIEDSKEILNLGWKELIKDRTNIVIVEWAERIRKILPKEHIRVKFRHRSPQERSIDIFKLK